MAEPTKEQWITIQQELAAGQMIRAIELYRRATGTGLTEAKNAVEAYYLKLSAEAPDQFPQRKKAGCAAAILLFAVGCAGIARFWA